MKKKILILSGGLKIGGVERVLIEYINNIDKERYDVFLLLMSEFSNEHTLTEFLRKDIDITYLKTLEFLHKKEYLKLNKKKMINRIRYNILLHYEKRMTKIKFKEYISRLDKIDTIIDFDRSFIKFNKEIRKFKKIIWLHSSFKNGILSDKNIKREKMEKNLNKYDNIVVVAEEIKEEVIKIAPILENKLRVIYNPLDFEKIIYKATEEQELSDSDKKLLKQKNILTVARLDSKSKDFPTLIKAYRELKKSGRKEKLYIIGEGEGRKGIEKLINDFDLNNDVFLLGQRKNPYVWIKNTELFVLSSKYEGLPTVIIEAMVLEKLIVSSNCSTGPKEILDNGACGLLFDVGNEFQCCDMIGILLNNKKLAETLIQNGRNHIREFDIKNIMEKFYRLI